MRLLTKTDRETVRDNNRKFTAEKYADFTTEIYLDIEIQRWSENAGGHLVLRIYRGTASKPAYYYYHKNTETRENAVKQWKESAERRNQWKKERRESNKGKRLTGAAACADAIRADLKKHLPLCKFSVRSETYSGGDSVHISWTDGYTTDQVETITKKYQGGHFNSMEDIYEYSESRHDVAADGTIVERPTAKYVFADRTTSEAVQIECGRYLCKTYGEEYYTLEQQHRGERLYTWVYRTLRTMELHNGFVETAVQL